MEKVRSFVDSKENPLALAGPFFLAIAVTFLWFFSKEVSSILPAAGLIGLTLTWFGRTTGLWLAQGVVFSALAASLWSDPLDFYWQSGFAFSMSVSLFITSLAQTETIDKTLSVEKELQEKLAALAEVQTSLAVTQDTLQEKEAFLSIARDEFLLLQKKQREWSDAVFEEKRKLAKVEELLEEQIIEIVDSPEYRRLNGAYLQLKEQFKEKDQVLVQTRKELFQTQEQVNALTKELDEFKLYGVPSEIAVLQKHCAEAEQEYRDEIERLRAEIRALEELVN